MALLPAMVVLRHRDFRLLWLSRIGFVLASQIQVIAIGWLVYNKARETMDVEASAFMIGMVGLAEFVPIFCLSLFAGQAADRFDRKTIILASFALEAVCSLGLMIVALIAAPIWTIFVVAVFFGASRSFMAPAITALQPTLVPREEVPSAVAWGSLAWQSGSIIGPAIGGYLYAAGPWLPFATGLGLILGSLGLAAAIVPPPRAIVPSGRSLALIGEGLVYVWRNRIVLGAISLDLFVVLLGGAVAMLPAYARDILHVGPDGLGHLRAAPAVGAGLVALILASRPIRRRPGVWMFGGVILFGLATLVFGLSTNMWLSLAALAVLGAGDMLSVYVRHSLIQISTPDEMRGRVSAASSIFISASNELGEFESGVMARFLGVVPSVVFGGCAALVIAVVWAAAFPQLRRADRLS